MLCTNQPGYANQKGQALRTALHQSSAAQALAAQARCQVQHERERDADEHVELARRHVQAHVYLATARVCSQGCAVSVIAAPLLPLRMPATLGVAHASCPIWGNPAQHSCLPAQELILMRSEAS